MIPNQIIEKVLDQADIVQVISEFVDLKKKGQNYQGRSPFTDEKTPSFFVSPSKRIFKCFSSGKSGGVVKFLKEYKGMSFPEAIEYLAGKYQIEIIRERKVSKDEEDHLRVREDLFNLNEFAASFFRSALPYSKQALDYAASRMTGDNQTEFNIGFAPGDWRAFQQAATKAGHKLTALILSGLVSQNDNQQNFDFFRNRLIFPVHNHQGRICAFAGRALDDSKPKYLNITNTPVYNKSYILYGLFFAQQTIRKLDFSVLVEGYTDVISLHAAGVINVVAPCGTALTPEHCTLLARYSSNVVLFYDGDDAGQNAAMRNARIALENKLIPFILPLPKEEDPDSFVRNNPDLEMPMHITANRVAFPLWLADKLLTETNDDPVLRNEAIKQISSVLILYQEDSLTTLFVETISKKFKIKKSLFFDKIKAAEAEAEPPEPDSSSSLPDHVDPREFHKWGFYEDQNQYYFDTKDGIQKFSNFIMKPLFHVESSIDAKRIFELTNFYGKKVTINFDMNEMTSLINFKRVIEGKGNFLFWGTEPYLMRLKQRWYEETKTCNEIRNLGWQKEGFWAWANGISTDEGFQEIDQTGLVVFNNRHYFIPAFSDIYLDDKSIFLDERKFLFLEREITLRNWAEQFIEVFGINGILGISFFIAALFRDHLLHLFNNFPILNLFGPKGTGKSQMAMSLSCLFGRQQTPFNIHNGTKAGLAEHIQQFVNAFAWIDEYKNNIEYDKIETLKSIYDAIGRNRLNYDKGKKKETTMVNSAVILSGQEMPTADVALFSRVIFLQFNKTEYSAEEKQVYEKLKAIEKQGLSCLTAEILKHRAFFIENYYHQYDQVLKDILVELNDRVVEDRILRNWCAIIASFVTLSSRLDLPFTYDTIKSEAVKLILNQNKQIATSNELATFWDLIESMYDANILVNNWHFLVTHAYSINTTKEGHKMLNRPMQVLKFKFNAIYQLYSEHIRRQGGKGLPATTLKYYLEKSKQFLGCEAATKFTLRNYDNAEGRFVDQKQVTTSYCFSYDDLQINLLRTLEMEKTDYPSIKTSEPFD